MSAVTINIPAIVALFDENKAVGKHTNAIKTMLGEPFMLGVLLAHLQEQGEQPEVLIDSNNKVKPCVSGQSSGTRLDAWIRTNSTLYQVEVKFWSAHGVGSGAGFRRNGEEWGKYRSRLWKTFWDEDRGIFREKSLQKVMTRMTPDPQDLGNLELKPLACLWSPVHDKGGAEPFFKVRPQKCDFEELWVFSVSTYLRQKSKESDTITLDLPDYADRVQLLNLIAPIA